MINGRSRVLRGFSVRFTSEAKLLKSSVAFGLVPLSRYSNTTLSELCMSKHPPNHFLQAVFPGRIQNMSTISAETSSGLAFSSMEYRRLLTLSDTARDKEGYTAYRYLDIRDNA